MDIQYHVQTIFPAPLHAVVDIPISFLDRFAVFRLYDRVIHRYADMVEAQPRDAPDVVFRDKGVKVLLCRSIELGEPAAQIETALFSIIGNCGIKVYWHLQHFSVQNRLFFQVISLMILVISSANVSCPFSDRCTASKAKSRSQEDASANRNPLRAASSL